MSATTVQYFRTKYVSDPAFLDLFRDVPISGLTGLFSPFEKKKGETAADASGQRCLRLGSDKLKEIK